MKRMIAGTFLLCLLITCAALFFSSREESAAYAASSDNEIVGSWYQLYDGEIYKMIQFTKDGKYKYFDGSDITMKGSYVYQPDKNRVKLDDDSFYCSVCGNGMLMDNVEDPDEEWIDAYLRA